VRFDREDAGNGGMEPYQPEEYAIPERMAVGGNFYMEKKLNVRDLTQLALLTAIILLMTFTPLGYLKIGVVEITFIMIPVVVGAVVMGPGVGAILGAVFGLSSFSQCFGMSAFGTMLFGVSPLRTFLVCMIPRVLMGWLCGLLFVALKKAFPNGIISYAVASLCGALINTVLFIAGLGLLFSDTMLGMATDSGISLLTFLISFITLNSLIEMGVCLVVGTAITKTVHQVVQK